MASIRQTIEQRITAALDQVLEGKDASRDAMLKQTQDPKFGDYQSNCALPLAKVLQSKPRDIAQQIIDALEIDDICEAPEIAGPGFINLRLSEQFISQQMQALLVDEQLGAGADGEPRRVVVDFSSPNLAKEMHVGHLRSTIIGDAICRTLEFQGHEVMRRNHLGDWGTQFGMLLEYVKRTQPQAVDDPSSFRVNDLEQFYKEAHELFKSDEEFKTAARNSVVDLQSGEPQMRTLWKAFCDESLRHCHEIYDRLGVKLVDMGESAYQEFLPGVVSELQEKQLAEESDGAICVFVPGYENRDGSPLPSIIQKSDGGFNYDTTDLAAVRYRVDQEKADQIIYVTDRGQAQHFDMIFKICKMAGWIDDTVTLSHIGFGVVQGTDRKRLRTRDGGTIKLKDLLDTAEEKAEQLLRENPRGFDEEQIKQIAHVVGNAAVKYADLSHSIESDYVFDWNTMVSFQGETGPYMLYANARTAGIARKAEVDFDALSKEPTEFELGHPAELALAKALLQFPDVVTQVSKQLQPNIMTSYLYGLSRTFSSFYDDNTGVRVVDAEPKERHIRLQLCNLTRRILSAGLGILGIEVVDEM